MMTNVTPAATASAVTLFTVLRIDDWTATRAARRLTVSDDSNRY